MMWLCPWFLYNIGLCSSGGGCCSDQPFPSNGICLLPADSGPCNNQYSLRWYHDPLTGHCRQFMYGGCEGNANNFPTKSNCVETCNAFPTDPDFCKTPVDRGPCTAHYEKWYYDESAGRCQQFIYGGCDGNDNKFDSEEECLAGCTKAADSTRDVAVPKSAVPCRPVTEPQTICTNVVRESPERCLQPLHQGPCDGNLPRWYFDSAARECLPFAYGGCHGNRNRFLTREICLTQCRSKVSPGIARVNYVHSFSTRKTIPKTAVTMTPTIRRMIFLNTVKSTEENGYRKQTDDPNGRPKINGVTGRREAGNVEAVVDGATAVVCLLQKDTGPCSDYTAVWYFDAASDTCRRFMYGGCLGNANRFATLEECQKTCLEQEARYEFQEQQRQQPTIAWKNGPFFKAGILPLNEDRSHRLLPQLPPVRKETYIRMEPLFGMDAPVTKKPPVRMAPPARMEPSLQTKVPWRMAQTTTIELWQQLQDRAKKRTQVVLSGFAEAEQQMDRDGAWQHDESSDEDVASVQQKSTGKQEDPKPPSTVDGLLANGDRCRLPEDRGRLCAKWRIQWFHDDHVSRCRRFYYGGCDGNENRFKTKEECDSACPGLI